MRSREMVELIAVRLPFGATRLMTDKARELEISRSELLRRAVEAFIAAQNHSSTRPQHDPR
jgi:hypothetical protein